MELPAARMSKPNRQQDREESWRVLMRAAQDGDRTAYARLLSELLPALRRIVRHRCRNPQDAEDIVQEVLLSVHAVRHTYDPTRAFMPWLMTITMRRITDAARKLSSRSANETTVDVLPETFSGHETKKEQDTSDDNEVIRRAISLLPPGQRQAIVLVKLRGLSLQEAATATGKSISSLKVAVHRAVKAMRRNLNRKI